MKSVWNFVRGKNHPRSFVDETIFLILTFIYWIFFVVLAVTPLSGIGFLISFVPLAFMLSQAFCHDDQIKEGSKTVMTGLFFFAIGEYLVMYFLRADYDLVVPYLGVGIVGMMLETIYVFIRHHRQRFTIVAAARSGLSNKLATVKTPTIRRPSFLNNRQLVEVKVAVDPDEDFKQIFSRPSETDLGLDNNLARMSSKLSVPPEVVQQPTSQSPQQPRQQPLSELDKVIAEILIGKLGDPKFVSANAEKLKKEAGILAEGLGISLIEALRTIKAESKAWPDFWKNPKNETGFVYELVDYVNAMSPEEATA